MECPNCGNTPNHLHQVAWNKTTGEVFSRYRDVNIKRLRMMKKRGDPDTFSYECPNCCYELTRSRKDAIAFLGMGNISEEMAKRFEEHISKKVLDRLEG